MIIHNHMLKLFVVIDHAIKTRLDLCAGRMTPEQKAIEGYKISGINEWRTLEKVAIEMMADEWLWMPEVTPDHIKQTLLFNYKHDRERQYETEVDRQVYAEIVQYVKGVFDNSEVRVTLTSKN